MSDWQPIETAPKDGTRFLAFGSYEYPGDPSPTILVELVWYSGDPHWPWRNDMESGQPNCFSHWMPLPSPPKPAAPDDTALFHHPV